MGDWTTQPEYAMPPRGEEDSPFMKSLYSLVEGTPPSDANTDPTELKRRALQGLMNQPKTAPGVRASVPVPVDGGS